MAFAAFTAEADADAAVAVCGGAGPPLDAGVSEAAVEAGVAHPAPAAAPPPVVEYRLSVSGGGAGWRGAAEAGEMSLGAPMGGLT